MYSNLVHMLDNTNCFLLLREVQIVLVLYTLCLLSRFFYFFVVFECISSNIVKRDMALSSDEVRIGFFLGTR